MFNRKLFLTVAACLALTASTALAGGNGGTKKDTHIKVVNNVGNNIYAFVDVSDAAITSASMAADPIAAFNALGGKMIAAGGNSHTFNVRAGSHTVTAVDIVAAAAVGKKTVEAPTKGQTYTVTFP